MGIVNTMKLSQVTGMVNRVKLKKMNIYFLSHVCGERMKLIHKITFSVQTCFLVWGHVDFGTILDLHKYDSTFWYTVKK
jgi:hypothetical protein